MSDPFDHLFALYTDCRAENAALKADRLRIKMLLLRTAQTIDEVQIVGELVKQCVTLEVPAVTTLPEGATYKSLFMEWERDIGELALKKFGTPDNAAVKLGLSVATFYRKQKAVRKYFREAKRARKEFVESGMEITA